MNVLSLFAGIGGLDLGLERAGMAVVGQVELDPYCQRVLAQHWPEVPRHDDVRTAVQWWQSRSRPRVDVVTGGFPCQPASDAGRRLGTDDPRWMWPAMADVIAAVRPGWVVWENVPGLLTRGLEHVHADLVRLGYRHRVGWTTACAVAVPHVRRRLFGVAHTHRLDGPPRLGHRSTTGPLPSRGAPQGPPRDRTNGLVDAPAPAHRGADGVPRGLDADRVRALGNAVVPAVAEHIGRLVLTGQHDSRWAA